LRWIAIDDHHRLIRTLERRQQEIRGFDHWVVARASSHPDADLGTIEA
jgi:hypothetical protein